MENYRIAIDIGGTFTDLAAFDELNGDVLNIKVASTPTEPAKAVVTAYQKFIKQRRENKGISIIIHATTIATNALLGQLNLDLPKTALITTKGFRDITEIGRQQRPELYNLFFNKPRSLIPRRMRFEVEERIDPEGRVVTSLNKSEAKRLIEKLKKKDVESIAVALLFAHINPKHEQQIGMLLMKHAPKIHVSLSSSITPEYREFERASTAMVNAILMPIVSSYLSELCDEVENVAGAPLCIMQSDGGVSSRGNISKKPVKIIESGPAAGVIASAFYGRNRGIENILSFDMGGTTAKAGAIKGAKPEVVSEYEVAGRIHSGRMVKGSGYPVRHPFIDLAECSSGGGTIAWVDEGNVLRVGPLSAGAVPGPACYGLGGTQPTVTDANVLLGRLSPKHLLGGEIRLHPELSKKAVLKGICKKTSLDMFEAAWGIIRIADSTMAKILRIVSVERGNDPRDFVLMCFGGAGPMHGCSLAMELGIEKIIVPPSPGLFSAYGLLAADFRNDLGKAIMNIVDRVNVNKVEALFHGLEEQGKELLEEQGVPPEDMCFLRMMDMRYFNQSYELTISASRPLNKKTIHQAANQFHEKHKAVYGYAAKGEIVELVNIRLTALGLVMKPKLKRQILQGKDADKAKIGERNVFFEERVGQVKTPVYEREKLKAGNIIQGPAVLEQYDATTIVYPDWIGSVDEFGNIIMSRVTGGK
ncbi:MAG: hydantoinase/oxoprolinase family protein [Candidatus Bathyarchaeota archaeon]